MPSGLTSEAVCSVTTPTKPTRTPPMVLTEYAGSARSSPRYTFAPRYGKSARSVTRPVRSAMPLSNSWLPTAEAVQPDLVQRVDRRVVVVDRRDERGGADVVAGRTRTRCSGSPPATG